MRKEMMAAVAGTGGTGIDCCVLKKLARRGGFGVGLGLRRAQGGPGLYSLIWSLVKPYRGSLAVVFVAMVLQMAATVAAPWPLKFVLDNVVGEHKLPHWLSDLLQPFFQHGTKMEIAAAAAIGLVMIALIGAIASGIANYYTASVGQYIANDLRLRTYDHLQQLSLNYYSEHDLGTSAEHADGGRADDSELCVGLDAGHRRRLLTILSMLAIMFWLNWDFTLIAVAITPFMLVIISRFKKAVKKAQKEVRKQQSNIVTVVQQGLESVRVIKAFGRQDLEQEELSEVSKATVDASLKARRVKAMLSPLVTVVVALCTAFVLWRSSSLILKGTMTAGALTVFLSYLAQFFKPVKDLATMTNTIAQTAVGVDRIQAILDASDVIPEKAGRDRSGAAEGQHRIRKYRVRIQQGCPRTERREFQDRRGRDDWRGRADRQRKVDDRELDSEILRSEFGARDDRWSRSARREGERAAQSDRVCVAGDGAVSRERGGQHRLWQRDGDAR